MMSQRRTALRHNGSTNSGRPIPNVGNRPVNERRPVPNRTRGARMGCSASNPVPVTDMKDPSEQIVVNIKNCYKETNETCVMWLKYGNDISFVKNTLAMKEGISEHDIILTLNGVPLDNRSKVMDWEDITTGAIIELHLRGAGDGPIKKRESLWVETETKECLAELADLEKVSNLDADSINQSYKEANRADRQRQDKAVGKPHPPSGRPPAPGVPRARSQPRPPSSPYIPPKPTNDLPPREESIRRGRGLTKQLWPPRRGTVRDCPTCASDTWLETETPPNRGTQECNTCDGRCGKQYWSCPSCAYSLCSNCIDPQAGIHQEEEDSDDTESADVEERMLTERGVQDLGTENFAWETKELWVNPGELGANFGPKTFLHRGKHWNDGGSPTETFMCIYEVAKDSQMDLAARASMGTRCKETLPWVIWAVNGKPMPNWGSKATGATDKTTTITQAAIDNDMDVIYDSIEKECEAGKPYPIKILVHTEASRGLSQGRRGVRRGGRRI